jgi:hypothetical protein
MKLIDQNFSQPQLNKIFSFLEGVNMVNNDFRSNKKIDGLQVFRDKYGNFYASYCLHFVGSDGIVSSLEYVEIDRLGDQTDLSTRYPNKADIAIKLSRYDQITLI